NTETTIIPTCLSFIILQNLYLSSLIKKVNNQVILLLLIKQESFLMGYCPENIVSRVITFHEER
ncbi:hypothetical protein PUR50_25400, partial [Enterobacter hormaechei subsp. steigerwaltii]|nr:hypothetical protein [Enterobacter hormaechei subsp. steigerwaltii]